MGWLRIPRLPDREHRSLTSGAHAPPIRPVWISDESRHLVTHVRLQMLYLVTGEVGVLEQVTHRLSSC